MPATLLPTEYPAPLYGPAQVLLERARKLFGRQKHAVSHTLRICSDYQLIERVPQGKQTRFVPCAWGVRRDDYRWRAADDGRDFTALRSGAAAMAWALVHAPLPCWAELLPGSMAQVMGTRSGLYLADYWMLVLHHLVWSKRLPYPIRARWVRGESIHDESFDFVSELPTGLAEASMDALILFQEAAAGSSLVQRMLLEPVGLTAPVVMAAVEPPALREGQWQAGCAEARAVLELAAKPPPDGGDQRMLAAAGHESLEQAEPSPEPPSDCRSSSALELDDQTFTIRHGGAVYQFGPRNKQLFALLERISRRVDHRVSFDDLRSVGDVWDGFNVEDSTVRGAVARLRKLLKEHEMQALAGRIATGTYRGSAYVVLHADNQREIDS